jgi:hypothetical protein
MSKKVKMRDCEESAVFTFLVDGLRADV